MAGDGPHDEVGSSRALLSPTVKAMEAQAVQDRTEQLVKLLEGRKRLLVWTHTHPDPDALGSAMGLRHLVKEKLGMESDFGLVGRVMRAENKAMVRCLSMDLTPVSELNLDDFDCIALVDTQPGFGHLGARRGVGNRNGEHGADRELIGGVVLDEIVEGILKIAWGINAIDR